MTLSCAYILGTWESQKTRGISVFWENQHQVTISNYLIIFKPVNVPLLPELNRPQAWYTAFEWCLAITEGDPLLCWVSSALFGAAQQQFLSASTHRVRMEPWRAHVCCWGRWVVTISLHTLDSWTTEQHFLQLDRSCLERCSWNLSKSKPQSDTSGYCCCLARTYKKAPNCGCFRPTLLCPEPGVSPRPVESGQSGCRMMLFGFSRLRLLGCNPSLLKELHKASTSTGKKKNKPPSQVVEMVPLFLFLWDRKGSTF